MKTQLVQFTENKNVRLLATEDTQYVLDLQPQKYSSSVSVEVVFETPGVTAEILGVFSLKSKQNLELTTIANHMVPNTSCKTKIKGVLGTNSKASYVGKIIIAKPAQQTSSFLEHGVLVMGEDTTSNSQPILEIEADDVKASHGSTTGRIDEEQVYYLTSRGLSRKEAEALIVEGYFESLLGTLEDQGVKDQIRSQVLL